MVSLRNLKAICQAAAESSISSSRRNPAVMRWITIFEPSTL